MNNLRPKTFDGIIGQDEIKNIIKIAMESAKQRNDVLPSIAMLGQAGLGKTTFAEVIANETGRKIHSINGAALRLIKNIVPHIMRIEYGDILFIDEIHRSNSTVQEFLYTCVEDYFCIIGSEEDTIRLDIPKFTFIVATTEWGTVLKPLRERIKLPLTFCLYQQTDLAKLACLNSKRLRIDIDQDAADSLGKRSRGTPRVLNRLLEWCRDYAISNSEEKLTIKNVDTALKLLEIDENGFTKDDQRTIMILKRAKKPIPFRTLSALTGIDEVTLANEVEPFLISRGIMTKTNRGRILC